MTIQYDGFTIHSATSDKLGDANFRIAWWEKVNISWFRILHNQRLQPLASPKLEIFPPGPPSKRETYKRMRNVREVHITSAKSLAARVQGPLKGPGSSGVLDALWCNLSLILGAFYPTNLFIYFIINLWIIFYPTQLEGEKIKLKRESVTVTLLQNQNSFLFSLFIFSFISQLIWVRLGWNFHRWFSIQKQVN